MEHACVNPYCSCAECDCEPPCSCGLALVGHSTEEVWDAGAGELRYTVDVAVPPRASGVVADTASTTSMTTTVTTTVITVAGARSATARRTR